MKKRFLLLLSVLTAISPAFAQGITTEKNEAGSFGMVACNHTACYRI